MYKYIYKLVLSRNTKSCCHPHYNCTIISDKDVESISSDKSIIEECLNRQGNERYYKSKKVVDDYNIEVQSFIICNMQYNEYLPENFYHLLHYIREAINIYNNYKSDQKINEILNKFSVYNFEYQDSEEIITFVSCPDAEYISVNASYYDQSRIYQYYNRVLQEIINTLSVESIKSYDKIGSIIDIENTYRNTSTLKEQLLNKIQCGMHVVFEALASFSMAKQTRNIQDWKYRYMYQYTKDLRAFSLEESLLHLRRSIILNHKCEALYREPINVTLSGRKDDSIGDINDDNKSDIISYVSNNFRSQEMVREMLDKFNKDYLIMNNPRFKKKGLATVIYIMYHSEYVKKGITYNDFKNKVCMYYDKGNISFKPNDVRNDAIYEYRKREYIYSKYKIRIR